MHKAIMAHKDELIRIYPEVAHLYGRGSCSSCQARSIAKALLKIGPREGLSIPLDSMLRWDTHEDFKKPIDRNEADKEHTHLPEADNSSYRILSNGTTGQYRRTCYDCSEKHLAQALILTMEYVSGYGDNINWALEHLERAAALTKDEGKRTSIKKVSDELFEAFDPVASRLERVEKHLLSLKELMPAGLNKAKWLIIGHLAEAADECARERPLLAAEIRDARLAFSAGKDISGHIIILLKKLFGQDKQDKPERSEAAKQQEMMRHIDDLQSHQEELLDHALKNRAVVEPSPEIREAMLKKLQEKRDHARNKNDVGQAYKPEEGDYSASSGD